jgi:hypothetical protein
VLDASGLANDTTPPLGPEHPACVVTAIPATATMAAGTTARLNRGKFGKDMLLQGYWEGAIKSTGKQGRYRSQRLTRPYADAYN